MDQTPALVAPYGRGQVEQYKCKQRPAALLDLPLVEGVHTIRVPKEPKEEDQLIVIVPKGCGVTIKICSDGDFGNPFLSF